MTSATIAPLRFNALTDRWLPLVQEDGSTVWASPTEVLCGEQDGIDLDYPRDDFRVYARLLLSALVQALFPAATRRELARRLDEPLDRAHVDAQVHPVLQDFDLFGPTPFLQIPPPASPPKKDTGAAPFVFPGQDLFQPPVPVDGIVLPIALVMLFAEQAYAGGAGRGYGTGPAGQPGALTLIDPGSIRRGAWANTLARDMAATRYAPDDQRPWSNAACSARRRASLGLVTGLFFQPRGIWLIPVGEGVCSFTGLHGGLVRRSPFLAKSQLAPRAQGVEDLWPHPCAPLAVNSQGLGPVRLHAERPAWTGLAQLLDPVSKKARHAEHPLAGPALVLREWKELGTRHKRPRLLVLDFDRDKANVKRRFFERFPLTDLLIGKTEAVERLRVVLDDAQQVRSILVRALTRAHDGQRRGGLALKDAETSYWVASERAFLAWLSAATTVEQWTPEDEALLEQHTQRMRSATRQVAQTIFDAHVSVSEFDPRKQARVAVARRWLRQHLYASDRVPQRHDAPAIEVTT